MRGRDRCNKQQLSNNGVGWGLAASCLLCGRGGRDATLCLPARSPHSQFSQFRRRVATTVLCARVCECQCVRFMGFNGAAPQSQQRCHCAVDDLLAPLRSKMKVLKKIKRRIGLCMYRTYNIILYHKGVLTCILLFESTVCKSF